MTDLNPEAEADAAANPEQPYELEVPTLLSPLAFDIETIPNFDMVNLLPEPKPKANLKDQQKIIADIAEKAAKQVDKMALNGTTGMIASIGFAGIRQDNHEYWNAAITYDPITGENEYLQAIMDYLSEGKTFATFNGMMFDIPFILRRCLACKISPDVQISTEKYKVPPVGNHFDLHQIIGHHGAMETGGFDFICKAMLGEGKPEGIDGSKVKEFWEAGKFEEISKYAMADALLTLKLWERCKGIYF